MGYKTRTDMLNTWAQFATTHPNLVSAEIVGKTVQGLDIPLYKIGNPNGGRVMFSGGNNGFEKAAVEVLTMFVDWVLNSGEADAQRILEQNYLLVLPILDLDGYPNLSGMNYNAVNLYRNFDFRWGMEGAQNWQVHSCSVKKPDGTAFPSTGATTNPECEAAGGVWYVDWTKWNYYPGPYPESEPEAQALLAVWLKYLPKHYMDCHAGGSGFKFWYSWLADEADKQKMIDVYTKYKARATAEGTQIYGFGENQGSSGCPVSASYHESGKKILGYVIEICTQTPPYDTLISTHFPNFKPVAVTLCQVSETPAPTETATLECEVSDMDTAGEFQVEVNGVNIYSCPSDKTKHNAGYFKLAFDIEQYLKQGQNSIRLFNPTSAACTVRNVKVTAYGTVWVDDVTATALQNWGGRIWQKTYSFSLGTFLECEVSDMDTAGEFQVEVNGQNIYSCPRDSSKHNAGYFPLAFDITAYVVAGQNTVRLFNPTTAACGLRNTKITNNGVILVSDTTVTTLQNYAGRTYQKIYPFSL